MLADDVAATLPELRAEAERLMTDTCQITRVDPDAPPPVMDGNLEYPEPARLTVYDGKCRVRIRSVSAGGSESDAGERQASLQEFELHLPVDGTGVVAVTDVAAITASRFDDSLVGRKFTVTNRHEMSQATARRLRVIEATG